MTTTASSPGIRQPIFLAGQSLLVGADKINWKSLRAENVERMLDSYAVIDRPYVSIGGPNVITKFTFEIGYPRISETDYRLFSEIEAFSGFFDLCIWKPISEIFSGDGNATEFILLRREAISQVPEASRPVGYASIYATSIKVDGTALNPADFEVGATPDSMGRTAIVFDTAPAIGVDNVRVFYTPLYYVRIVDPERDLSTPFRETGTLRLEEV